MPFISWDDSFSVNVSEIDKQHMELVRLINELNDAMKARKAQEELGKILQGLINYTIAHFSLEERYFDRFYYPDSASHKKEHEQFVDKVYMYKEDYESGKLLLSTSVMNFLKDWLLNHIKISDQQYTDCFNRNGLY